MRNADACMASYTTLCHALQTDTRLTILEQARITAINIVQDAAGDTTREEDAFIAHIMQKIACQTPNYSPV